MILQLVVANAVVYLYNFKMAGGAERLLDGFLVQLAGDISCMKYATEISPSGSGLRNIPSL